MFAYNRPEHLSGAIRSLKADPSASERALIVVSDGPATERDAPLVAQVRAVAGSTSGFGSVELVERPKNLTGPVGIPLAISETLERTERVIVLEDDLEVSPGLLAFLDRGLDLYESEPRVACVSGSCFPHRKTLPPTYFLRGAYSEAWATWRSAWSSFEPDAARLLARLEGAGLQRAFDLGGYPRTAMLRPRDDGREVPWDIRWHASAFLQDAMTLLPNVSLVRNVGFDGTGTNVGSVNPFEMPLALRGPDVEPIPIEEHPVARRELARCLRSGSGWRARLSARLRPG